MKLISKCLLAASSLALSFAALNAAASLSPVAFFDGTKNEYPESIAADHRGNLYMGLVFGGKIIKISPKGVKSDYATIDDNWLLGITFDKRGNLVALGSSGVWKVAPGKPAALFASIPGHNFLNDLAYDHHGNLYVTDSFGFRIWKVDPQGNAISWSTDILLQSKSPTLFPNGLGPNGIRYDRKQQCFYVINTSAGRLIQIDLNKDGSAGVGRTIAEDTRLEGGDGIELDGRGNVFVAVNIQDRIAKVSRDGRVSDVAVDDILATPTGLVRDRNKDSDTFYVCNNGNVFFSSTPIGEGLIKLELDGDEEEADSEHGHDDKKDN